jgi:branched-chain amino acid transport system substrate-binding protein
MSGARSTHNQETPMRQPTRRHVLQLGAAGASALALPQLALAQSGPLRIGLITPLSGPQEFIGTYVKNGAEVAVDQINKAGGILGRQVALEIRDDKANPAAALAAARELLGRASTCTSAASRVRSCSRWRR